MPDVSARRKLTGYVGILFVTILAGLILKIFVVDAFVVPSASMQPTLLAGDYVFVNKLIYGARVPRLFHFLHIGRFPGIRDIERGDVIFFEFPDSSSRSFFVKRCAGLPGDTFEFRHHHLLINGIEKNSVQLGDIAWSENSIFTIPRSGDIVPLSPATVHQYQDIIRREGHTIDIVSDEVLIDGAKATQYEFRENYLFVLGDNINHSYDSRSWGLLPEDNVEGKAMVIYLSRDVAESKIRWNRIGKFVY
jgi:signal peptidase I